MARDRGWELAESLCAYAPPAGITPRPVYEALRDEILNDLDAAGPIDAVIVNLHGAMVADGYDDCGGDILQRIRKRVGPNVPVGVELDPHCHLTRAKLENATALVLYKEFPHTDFAARAADLFRIIARGTDCPVWRLGQSRRRRPGRFHLCTQGNA
jgi:microcystin degradation protein MlrC